MPSTKKKSSTPTAQQMAGLVGSTAKVEVSGFSVPMEIHDVKIAYGNIRLLVSPQGGEGEAWIDAGRIINPRGERDTFPLRAQSKLVKPSSKDADIHAQVREWARAQGIPVNSRGRVATALINKYRSEQTAK